MNKYLVFLSLFFYVNLSCQCNLGPLGKFNNDVYTTYYFKVYLL